MIDMGEPIAGAPRVSDGAKDAVAPGGLIGTIKVEFIGGGASVGREAEIISLEQERAAREAKERMRGTCARGMKEECGMKDPRECRVHAPYLKPDDAS